jgi:hypothetical protein
LVFIPGSLCQRASIPNWSRRGYPRLFSGKKSNEPDNAVVFIAHKLQVSRAMRGIWCVQSTRVSEKPILQRWINASRLNMPAFCGQKYQRS